VCNYSGTFYATTEPLVDNLLEFKEHSRWPKSWKFEVWNKLLMSTLTVSATKMTIWRFTLTTKLQEMKKELVCG